MSFTSVPATAPEGGDWSSRVVPRIKLYRLGISRIVQSGNGMGCGFDALKPGSSSVTSIN